MTVKELKEGLNKYPDNMEIDSLFQSIYKIGEINLP